MPFPFPFPSPFPFPFPFPFSFPFPSPFPFPFHFHFLFLLCRNIAIRKCWSTRYTFFGGAFRWHYPDTKAHNNTRKTRFPSTPETMWRCLRPRESRWRTLAAAKFSTGSQGGAQTGVTCTSRIYGFNDLHIGNIAEEVTFVDLDSYVEAVGSAGESGSLSALCDQFESHQEPAKLAIRDDRELFNPIPPVTLFSRCGIFLAVAIRSVVVSSVFAGLFYFWMQSKKLKWANSGGRKALRVELGRKLYIRGANFRADLSAKLKWPRRKNRRLPRYFPGSLPGVSPKSPI